MTKIIVDENVPKDARDWLSKKGFETLTISQILVKSAKDLEIAEYAAKNKTTIITLDKGFAQHYRAFQKRAPLTIIIIRVNPPTPMNIIDALNLAQKKINMKEIQEKLIIITKKKIRIIT